MSGIKLTVVLGNPLGMALPTTASVVLCDAPAVWNVAQPALPWGGTPGASGPPPVIS